MKLIRFPAYVFLLLALLVAGCGGGGSSSGSSTPPVSTQKATPTLSVDWPLRTRNAAGPSSALSVSFALAPLTVSGSSITFSGNRSTGLAAHTDVFTAASSGLVGEWMLTGSFYANASETGAVVGTVSIQVELSANGMLTNPNGTPLGTISFTPTIQRVVIAPSQTVPFLSTAQLTATPYDVNNNPVVVTPGSFNWTQTTGSSNFSLTPDGIATPILNGSGMVTATIDGLTSAAVAVTVVPTTISFNYSAYAFAYDASRTCFYASVVDSGGNASIMKINATTGAVLGSVAMPAVESLITVSTDATTLYALSILGTIEQVNLSSLSITGSASLPAGGVGLSIAALPSAPNSWLVATRDSNFNDAGTYVYDGLTPRANSAQIGLSMAVSADGTTAYGYQYFTIFNPSITRSYSTATIGANGLTALSSVACPFQGVTTQIHSCDNLILADDGSVLTPSTGALVTTLAVTETGHSAAGTATGSHAYVVQYSPAQILSFDLGSDALLNTYVLPSTVTGNLSSLTSVGPGAVAFHNSAGTTNQFYLTVGLP